jgi:hypothetical protein
MKSDMASEKPAAAARCVIAREEYDFSDVPETELKSCLWYEYMRESATIRERVARIRRRFLKEIKTQNAKVGDSIPLTIQFKKVTGNPALHEAVMHSMLAFRSEFPGVAWQSLSSEAKDALRGFPARAEQFYSKAVLKEKPMLVMDAILKDPSLGRLTLSAWKEKRTPKNYRKLSAPDLAAFLVSGFFQINMGYSPKDLIGAFRDWVMANHPKATDNPKERRGRNSIRDRLNALGALRLRYYCRTLAEAKRIIAPLAPKPHGMAYSTRTAWKRACDAAVEYFHSLLRLPEDQSPIHFTKGWQK